MVAAFCINGMEMAMRSYHAARSLFSFLAFIAWCLIAGGACLTFLGAALATEMARWNNGPPALAIMIGVTPGILMMVAGFFSLVVVQIGRAGVDTAEYSQQMLQISRDHLQVSEQTLRQGETIKQSFEALQTGTATEPAASFESLRARQPAEPAVSEKLPKPVSASAPVKIEYRGKDIVILENGVRYAGIDFKSLDAAKGYIDQFDPNPKAELPTTS